MFRWPLRTEDQGVQSPQTFLEIFLPTIAMKTDTVHLLRLGFIVCNICFPLLEPHCGNGRKCIPIHCK